MNTNTEFVIYHGHIVAVVSATRFQLCGDLRQRPPDDPERNFVQWMCFYAGELLRGAVDVPYTDADARQFAREILIPKELRDHPLPNPQHTSWAIGVPVDELLDRSTWFQPGAVALVQPAPVTASASQKQGADCMPPAPGRHKGVFRFGR